MNTIYEPDEKKMDRFEYEYWKSMNMWIDKICSNEAQRVEIYLKIRRSDPR